MEYVSKMRKNIKELVDFEKLKKCNDLCFKWSKRMRVVRRDYMKFILGIYRNPESIVDKIKPKYLAEYKKDIQHMFYAQQIENLLAEQYHAMIFNIMQKMRIHPDRFDEFVSDGFLAIRSSTWQYRTHKVKATFTTFVHKAIFMRIKGQLNKLKLKKERRKNFHLYYESNFDSEMFSFNNFSKHIETEHTNNFDNEINKIVFNAKLDDREECMLRCFVNRKIDELWYEEYQKKFINTKTNKPYSRQSIYNQLLAVQNKVAKHMRINSMIDPNFTVPTTHYGDLR